MQEPLAVLQIATSEHDMYSNGLVTHDRRYAVPRRYPRYLLSFPVSIERLGKPGQPVMHGMSLDLSRGGGSAVLCGPPAVGEIVRILLQFSGTPLEALAVVRHSRSTRSGFEFLELSPADQERLVDHVHALEEHSWPWQPELVSPASVPHGCILPGVGGFTDKQREFLSPAGLHHRHF